MMDWVQRKARFQKRKCAAIVFTVMPAFCQTLVTPRNVPWAQVNLTACGIPSTSGTRLNINQIRYPSTSLATLPVSSLNFATSMAGPFSPQVIQQSTLAMLTPNCWPVELQTNAWSVLITKCTRCHGVDLPGIDPNSPLVFAKSKAEVGNLDLRTYTTILQGGTRGPAMVPGNSAASTLYTTVAAALIGSAVVSASGLLYPPAMPEGGPLLPTEIDAIKQWIDAGAPRFSIP